MNRLAIIAVTGALALTLAACDEGTTKKETSTETLQVEKPKAGEAGKVKENTTTTTTPSSDNSAE